MDGWIYPEWDDPISDGQLKMDLGLSYIARILRFSWFNGSTIFPNMLHVWVLNPPHLNPTQIGHCWNPFARCPPQ
jgi:hypothetical protein